MPPKPTVRGLRRPVPDLSEPQPLHWDDMIKKYCNNEDKKLQEILVAASNMIDDLRDKIDRLELKVEELFVTKANY